MPKFKNAYRIPDGMMPYVINKSEEDDTAEITMYGEVVQSVPTDWWTGERLEGLYIVLSDFLQDIDDLKTKSSVTVHINSVGGDADAGIAIYNRLKEMQNVTTICDSLAASAASIIFQAGAKRQMYQGSQLMVHGTSTVLIGSYNRQDLKQVDKMLESYNDTLTNIYAERSGEDVETIKNHIAKTTWMTAEEAVEKGYADEIITTATASLNMAANNRFIVCNGVPMDARSLGVIPESIPSGKMPKGSRIDMIQSGNGNPEPVENKSKEVTKMTKEELMAQDPELVEQIRNEAISSVQDSQNSQVEEAVKAAVASERQRIADIESIEASIADKQMIQDAKFGENPVTAKDLAFAAMQKQAQLGNTFLHDMQEDTKNSGANEVPASSAPEETAGVVDMTAAINAVNARKGGK